VNFCDLVKRKFRFFLLKFSNSKEKMFFFFFKNHQTFKTIVLIIYCQATQIDVRAILGGSFAVGTIENPSQG